MKYIMYTWTFISKKFPVVKSVLPPIPFNYNAIRNVSTLDQMHYVGCFTKLLIGRFPDQLNILR